LYTLEKGSKHYLAKKRRNDHAAGVAIINSISSITRNLRKRNGIHASIRTHESKYNVKAGACLCNKNKALVIKLYG
jgi:hypothetical protein